jgi:peroxiredoxin
LRQQESGLAERDVRVKVVAFDDNVLARNYVRETGLPWPLLLDTDQSLYSAYGMTRGSWWSIYGPASVGKYLKLMAGGRQPGKPGRDWRQLGGDVLIDPQGMVRLHHVSAGPHDRPDVAELLAVIDQADG